MALKVRPLLRYTLELALQNTQQAHELHSIVEPRARSEEDVTRGGLTINDWSSCYPVSCYAEILETGEKVFVAADRIPVTPSSASTL